MTDTTALSQQRGADNELWQPKRAMWRSSP